MTYWTMTDEQQLIVDKLADKLNALDDFILSHTEKQDLKAEFLFGNCGYSELLGEYSTLMINDLLTLEFEEFMRVRFFERHLSKNAGEAVAIAFATALQHSDTTGKLKTELSTAIDVAKARKAYEKKAAKIVECEIPGVQLLFDTGKGFNFSLDQASEVVIQHLKLLPGAQYKERSLSKGTEIERSIVFDYDKFEPLIEKLGWLHEQFQSAPPTAKEFPSISP
jgi:hypothetical protein